MWLVITVAVISQVGFIAWSLLTFGVLGLGPLGMILAAFVLFWYTAHLIPVLPLPARLLRVALLGGIAIGSIAFWIVFPLIVGDGLYD